VDAQYAHCVANLNIAITKAEIGYRVKIVHPDSPDAASSQNEAQAELSQSQAQCMQAYQLGGGTTRPLLQGSAVANNDDAPPQTDGGQPQQGSPSDAGTPGIGTPGTTDGGGPETPQTPGTQPGPPPGTPLQGTPPGTKGISRTPVPATPTPSTSDTPSPPNIPAIDKAMSACLSKKLPYLVQQTVSPEFLQLALSSAPASARAVPFAQLPGESQVFLEETAMGLQAQVAHNNKYGSNEYSDADARDYMVGWLDDCLLNAGLQQDYTNDTTDDPRAAYAKFLGVPLSDHRLDMFNSGYQDGSGSLPPLPLMPPETPSPNPGVLPLKPSPTSGSVP
jgi:hypothetical protein